MIPYPVPEQDGKIFESQYCTIWYLNGWYYKVCQDGFDEALEKPSFGMLFQGRYLYIEEKEKWDTHFDNRWTHEEWHDLWFGFVTNCPFLNNWREIYCRMEDDYQDYVFEFDLALYPVIAANPQHRALEQML